MTEEQKENIRVFIDAVINEWGYDSADEFSQSVISFIESDYDLSRWNDENDK